MSGQEAEGGLFHEQENKPTMGSCGFLDENGSLSPTCQEPLACAVDENSDENNSAADQRVEIWIGVDDDEAVLHALDEQRSKNGTGKNGATPAEETCSTEDRGRNRSEFAVGPERRRNSAELRERKNATQGRAKPADNIN